MGKAFGPHAARIIRKLRLTGMVLSASGELINTEMAGPSGGDEAALEVAQRIRGWVGEVISAVRPIAAEFTREGNQARVVDTRSAFKFLLFSWKEPLTQGDFVVGPGLFVETMLQLRKEVCLRAPARDSEHSAHNAQRHPGPASDAPTSAQAAPTDHRPWCGDLSPCSGKKDVINSSSDDDSMDDASRCSSTAEEEDMSHVHAGKGFKPGG